MKKLIVNNLGAEILISKNKKNIFWENYDLIFWKKKSSGYLERNGMFIKNNWGVYKRFKIQDNGLWELPAQYVKYFK